MRMPILVVTLAALAGCGSGGDAGGAAAGESPNAAPAPAASAPPAAPAGPVAIPGGAVSKEELAKAVCYFTPDEIQRALGFAVSAGVASTTMLESGMASCRYDGQDNSLWVTAYWIDPAQVATARQGMTRMSGGGMTETIPGDPDSAYLHDQQDNGSSLHYLRRNLRIQVQATSGRVPFATMKPKLLALRRVP